MKLEGGVTVAATVKRMVQCGIPVMGHIGLTPQSVNQLGGWRVQGKTPEAASQLLQDALALEEAGAFSIVLEQVPTPLATLISRRLTIPTIGIGAGNGCDGQVLVIHDVFGLSDRVPKLAKKYASIGEIMRQAVTQYFDEVRMAHSPPRRTASPWMRVCLLNSRSRQLPGNRRNEHQPRSLRHGTPCLFHLGRGWAAKGVRFHDHS